MADWRPQRALPEAQLLPTGEQGPLGGELHVLVLDGQRLEERRLLPPVILARPDRALAVCEVPRPQDRAARTLLVVRDPGTFNPVTGGTILEPSELVVAEAVDGVLEPVRFDGSDLLADMRRAGGRERVVVRDALGHRRSSRSPDDRHVALFTYAGDIRFGPLYWHVTVAGRDFGDRVFGHMATWSSDGRHIALQEWLSTEESHGPRTRLVVVEVDSGRETTGGQRPGFIEALELANGRVRWQRGDQEGDLPLS